MFKYLNENELSDINFNIKKIILSKYLMHINLNSTINIDRITSSLSLGLDLKKINSNIPDILKKELIYIDPFKNLKFLNSKNDEYLFKVYIYWFIIENYNNNSKKFVRNITNDYMNQGNLSFEDIFVSFFDDIVDFLNINFTWKVGNELSYDNSYDSIELNWINSTFKENIEWALNTNELLIVDLGINVPKDVYSEVLNVFSEFYCLSLNLYKEHLILSVDFNCFLDECVTYKLIANILFLLNEINMLQKVH